MLKISTSFLSSLSGSFSGSFVASVFAVSLLLIPHTARAEQKFDYSFDKAHTQIIFFVDHLGFAKSMGKFLDFEGGFNFDETKPTQALVHVDIKTASIEMNDEKWNAHMKNQDFFDVEKFPSMTFKSTKVELTGDKTADVHGDLTLLGVTKPVVLKTVFNKRGIHPYAQKDWVGFSGTANLKRSDFGMNYGLPAVGDDVEIRIEVEGMRND